MIKADNLFFNFNEWEAVVSEKTLKLHYEKHYKAYVDKTNELVIGTKFEEMPLETIIKETHNDKENFLLYQNAGQVYNHNMYWKSFGIGEVIENDIKNEILLKYGTAGYLADLFVEEAKTTIGSGWLWLVKNNDGELEIMRTYNGKTPLVYDVKPLFNVDIWEHAYYLDYQNERLKYVKKFILEGLKL